MSTRLLQYPDLSEHQALISSEEFAGTGVADEVKGALPEAAAIKLDGPRVGVRLACDLTQNPIASTGVGQRHGRAQLGLR